MWLERLTAYNYTLEYHKSSANGNANFISACLCLQRSSTTVVPEALLRPTKNASSSSAPTAYVLADPALCVSVWVGSRSPHDFHDFRQHGG